MDDGLRERLTGHRKARTLKFAQALHRSAAAAEEDEEEEGGGSQADTKEGPAGTHQAAAAVASSSGHGARAPDRTRNAPPSRGGSVAPPVLPPMDTPAWGDEALHASPSWDTTAEQQPPSASSRGRALPTSTSLPALMPHRGATTQQPHAAMDPHHPHAGVSSRRAAFVRKTLKATATASSASLLPAFTQASLSSAVAAAGGAGGASRITTLDEALPPCGSQAEVVDQLISFVLPPPNRSEAAAAAAALSAGAGASPVRARKARRAAAMQQRVRNAAETFSAEHWRLTQRGHGALADLVNGKRRQGSHI